MDRRGRILAWAIGVFVFGYLAGAPALAKQAYTGDPRAQLELAAQVGQDTGKAVATWGSIAYLGMGPRLHVLDVSDPSQPTEIGIASAISVPIARLAADGNLVFLLDEETGFHVMNVADSASPIVLGEVAPVAERRRGSGDPLAMTEEDRLAYIAAGDLIIIDANDASRPSVVGRLAFGGARAYSVAVEGKTAYVAACQMGLVLVDVSDPTAPHTASSVPSDECAASVVVSGSTAYVGDTTGLLRVIDVSDASHPRELGRYRGSGSGTDTYLAKLDDRTVLMQRTGYRSGTVSERVDVGSPASPVWVGSGRTGIGPASAIEQGYAFIPSTSGLTVYAAPARGSWEQVGAFSRLTHATAVAFNESTLLGLGSGLHVLDMTDPTKPTELGASALQLGASTSLTVGMAVLDGKAYVTGSRGMQIFDVSQAGRPVMLGTYASPSQGILRRPRIVGSIVYVAFNVGSVHSNGRDSGIEAIDVSDPANAVLVGSWLADNYVSDLELISRVVEIGRPQPSASKKGVPFQRNTRPRKGK